MVDLVLDEKVDQWHKGSKEGACEELPIAESSRVAWAQSQTSKCPRKSRYEVGNHEDVVPIVVVGRGDIGPATACQCAEYANTSDEFRQRRIWFSGEDVPQADQCNARTCRLLSYNPENPPSRVVPDVRAMKSMKTDRSG